jgi:hypothetical protein
MGNAGRDIARGPNFFNTDIALLKDTRLKGISEGLDIQFRAGFFNIFNHTNLGLPITGNAGAPGAPLFLNATGGRIPNAGQITSMVGTPRQIQLALKLIF